MSLSNVSSFFFHIDDVLWWYHQIFDVEVLMLRDMGVDGPLVLLTGEGGAFMGKNELMVGWILQLYCHWWWW